jgi:hypothetical protein
MVKELEKVVDCFDSIAQEQLRTIQLVQRVDGHSKLLLPVMAQTMASILDESRIQRESLKTAKTKLACNREIMSLYEKRATLPDEEINSPTFVADLMKELSVLAEKYQIADELEKLASLANPKEPSNLN